MCLWICAHLSVFVHFGWRPFGYYSTYICVCSKYIAVGPTCVIRCAIDVAHFCKVVSEGQGNIIISFEIVGIKHDPKTHTVMLLAWHATVARKYKLLQKRNWHNGYLERIYQIFRFLSKIIKYINRSTCLCLASRDFGVPIHRITCIYGG